MRVFWVTIRPHQRSTKYGVVKTNSSGQIAQAFRLGRDEVLVHIELTRGTDQDLFYRESLGTVIANLPCYAEPWIGRARRARQNLPVFLESRGMPSDRAAELDIYFDVTNNRFDVLVENPNGGDNLLASAHERRRLLK